MSTTGRVGVLGGTFDPIHDGHLAAGTAAADAIDLQHVLFIPSHQPPHRTLSPRASVYHRFAMVSIAVAADPRFAASDLELTRPGPSYSADTLRRLRQLGVEPWQLFFITGADAFAEIATWREYPALLDLANFVVISRPGRPLDALASRLPELAHRMQEVEPGRPWQPAPGTTRIVLVKAATPDVSSTDIRERLAGGAPLDGVVPAGVERHIHRHRLYHEGSGDTALPRAEEGDC